MTLPFDAISVKLDLDCNDTYSSNIARKLLNGYSESESQAGNKVYEEGGPGRHDVRESDAICVWWSELSVV